MNDLEHAIWAAYDKYLADDYTMEINDDSYLRCCVRHRGEVDSWGESHIPKDDDPQRMDTEFKSFRKDLDDYLRDPGQWLENYNKMWTKNP